MGGFTQPLYPSTGGASFSVFNNLLGGVGGAQTAASALLPAANLVFYAPVSLTYRIRIKNLWWFNGSAVAGNADVGIYSSVTGTKLVSAGATAQAGTNAKQTVTLGSSFELLPGKYYFGFVGTSASGRYAGWTGITAQTLRKFGYCEDTVSSSSLPATMSPQQAATLFQAYVGADLA